MNQLSTRKSFHPLISFHRYTTQSHVAGRKSLIDFGQVTEVPSTNLIRSSDATTRVAQSRCEEIRQIPTDVCLVRA